MKKVTPIPPVRPTLAQRKWMEREKKKTGDSFNTIIKRLIQKEIDGE